MKTYKYNFIIDVQQKGHTGGIGVGGITGASAMPRVSAEATKVNASFKSLSDVANRSKEGLSQLAQQATGTSGAFMSLGKAFGWTGTAVTAAIGLGIAAWKKHKEEVEKSNRELRSFSKDLKERNDSVMKQITEQYKPEPSPEAKNRRALENELTKLLSQRNAIENKLNEAIKKNVYITHRGFAGTKPETIALPDTPEIKGLRKEISDITTRIKATSTQFKDLPSITQKQKENLLDLQIEQAHLLNQYSKELALKIQQVKEDTQMSKAEQKLKIDILELQEKQRKERAAIALEKEFELAELENVKQQPSPPRGILSVSDLWNEWRMMQSENQKEDRMVEYLRQIAEASRAIGVM